MNDERFLKDWLKATTDSGCAAPTLRPTRSSHGCPK